MAVLAAGLSVGSAQATIVEVQTTQGNFQINLFDEGTPKTVENFLKYVNDGSYEGTVFHRLSTNFVLQGTKNYDDGDFDLTKPVHEIDNFSLIESKGNVVNEPKYSNVRGTVAMAKLPNLPDSATNQWFINLKDNSETGAQLDVQNAGFTVFGQIVDDGMTLIDEIAKNQCNELPIIDMSSDDCKDYKNGNKLITADKLLRIEYISIIDSNTNTLGDLSPKENTLIKEPVQPPDLSNDSGGSFGALLTLMGGLLVFRRKRTTH